MSRPCPQFDPLLLGLPFPLDQRVERMIEREITIYGEPLSPEAREIIRRKQWGYNGVKYVAYFWCNGWRHLSLGVSLYLGKAGSNVEIHVPGGFFRIGYRQFDNT